MIRYTSENQLPLSGFETPFESMLDDNNRWVTLASLIPWDELATAYYSSFNNSHGRPAKDARLGHPEKSYESCFTCFIGFAI